MTTEANDRARTARRAKPAPTKDRGKPFYDVEVVKDVAYYDGPATVHCAQSAAAYLGQDRRRHPCN